MIPAALIETARAIPIEAELARRGVKLRGHVERVGPCPACGGRDRFSINTRKQIFNCRGCQIGGDVIAFVQHVDGVGFAAAVETLTGDIIERPQAAARERPAESNGDYERHQVEKARWLWRRRRPIAGSPAETYLIDVRGYDGPMPATLGYLRARGEYAHAMIAAYGMPIEPEPGVLAIAPDAVRAVHLTRLDHDGSGPRKITIGSPLGSPIVLAPANDLLELVIVEGIEDALSAHAATGLGSWAAGSAGYMPALAGTVPGYVECISIIVDADTAGQSKSAELAERLRQRYFEVFFLEKNNG